MSDHEMYIKFARNLTRLIERRGITQADVAAYMEVTEAAVSTWCNGKKMPRFSKLDKLCVLLQCDKNELFAEAPALHQNVARLTLIELELIKLYRSINDEGQNEILNYTKYIASQDKYTKGEL